MSKFTKGPWRLSSNLVYGDNGRGSHLVGVIEMGFYETEEERANKWLILAAPDMHEALRRMADVSDEEVIETDFRAIARTALKKA